MAFHHQHPMYYSTLPHCYVPYSCYTTTALAPMPCTQQVVTCGCPNCVSAKENGKAKEKEKTEEKKDADWYVNRANELYDKGHFLPAIELYNEALKLDSKRVDALYNRGNAHRQKKEWELAIDNYKKVIDITPRDSQAYTKKAFCYYQIQSSSSIPKAITAASMAIQINPDEAEAYLIRANCLKSKHQFDKALEDYGRCIGCPKARDSVLADAHCGRAEILIRDKQHLAAAKADIIKALELNPNKYNK